MSRFVGRTVLVSGAAQGIGRAIAAAFAAEGARVHATDIDAEGLAGTARATGATPHPADLSDPAAARALRPRCRSMMMREQWDMKEKASPCTFWKSSRYIDSCTCNAQ
ncbi:MAG: SDR family NAD(P)-dependent oxidoreductase, partial [Gemmobacter sp.]